MLNTNLIYFLQKEAYETCKMDISYRWNFWLDIHRSSPFYRENDGNQTAGVLLWIHLPGYLLTDVPLLPLKLVIWFALMNLFAITNHLGGTLLAVGRQMSKQSILQ
jgi:disulfide bond formation protein DsbB